MSSDYFLSASGPLFFPVSRSLTPFPSPPLLIWCGSTVKSIIEGLYLLLNLPPWSTASSYWTEKIWLDIPAEVARTRLVSRHLETGVESVLEEAEKRGTYRSLLAATELYGRKEGVLLGPADRRVRV